MIVGRLLLAAVLLVATPAAWGQFSKAEMAKLAIDRMDSVAKALKLSPQQIEMIKPLLEGKYRDMGEVRKRFLDGNRTEATRREAVDSLKSVSSRYNDEIAEKLSPDQLSKWKGLQKKWKDDLVVKMPAGFGN
jgi:hypothetical protein